LGQNSFRLCLHRKTGKKEENESHMDLVFVISTTMCLSALLLAGMWRKLPLFTIATLASLLLELSYQPYSAGWLKSWYPWLVTPLLACRSLAVAEAFVVSSHGFRHRRMIAAAALFLALLFAAVIAWRFASADVLHSAIQARRVVVVGLSAFLGVYMLLMWSVGYKRSGVFDLHVLLMFLLCSVMGATSVMRMARLLESWQAANDASYAACSMVYLTWVVAFWTQGRQLDPPLLETHSTAG
jgi:hypothetical protein